jgi:hypothetical protein
MLQHEAFQSSLQFSRRIYYNGSVKARLSILGLAFRVIYSTKRAGFSYSILCREPLGGICHHRSEFPRRRVTPEVKIRQLCARLIAAKNDEAAERILQELRHAIHDYCERLRRRVAQEYPFHKDDMAAD